MENTSFLNGLFLDTQSLITLSLRLLFNLIVIYIITRQIYYRVRKKRDYLFTFFIVNVIVFFVCYLLNNAKISIGFAFGIFAVFSILRYRTRPLPTKEMTYLFISISVAIINALSSNNLSYAELLLTNGVIIFFTIILEKVWIKNESRKTVIYEKIDLIKPENHDKLLKDLKERTGLNIHRFEIGRIDFLQDLARIRIYYYDQEQTEDEE